MSDVKRVFLEQAKRLWNFVFAKNKRDIAIGLSVGHSNVIAVEVEIKSGEHKILNIVSREIQPNVPLADVLKDMFATAKFNTDVVNTSLSGSAVITRFVNFPYMNKKDLRNSLEFEAENYIPFNLSDVYLDYSIIGEKKEDSKKFYSLALVAIKKEAVDERYAATKDAGVQLAAIDIDSFSCFNLFTLVHPECTDGTVALINIGSELTTITVVQNGEPAFTRDLVFGGLDVTKKMSKLKGLSLEETEAMKLSLDVSEKENKAMVKESLAYFLREVKLSLNFFRNQVSSKPDTAIDSVYFLGGSSGLAGLCDIVTEELNIAAHLFNPVKKFVIGESVDLPLIEKLERSLSVPLGLALRRD